MKSRLSPQSLLHFSFSPMRVSVPCPRNNPEGLFCARLYLSLRNFCRLWTHVSDAIRMNDQVNIAYDTCGVICNISIGILFHLRSRSLCRQATSFLIGFLTTQIQQFAIWKCVCQLFVNCSPSLETVPEVFVKVNSNQFPSRFFSGEWRRKKLWREKQPEIRLASTWCFLL